MIYHYEYTATANNTVDCCSGKCLNNWNKITSHYVFQNKNIIEIKWKKYEEGLS